MYLQPLADKFARLVLQLLARYAVWLADSLSARRAASGTTSPQDPPSAAIQVKATSAMAVLAAIAYKQQ